MKFALQLAAIIVAVLVAHYLPAPDPENFSAVEMPPWWAIALVVMFAYQTCPTTAIVNRSRAAWEWVKARMPTNSKAWILPVALLPAALVAGMILGAAIATALHKPPSPPTPVVDPVVPETPVKVSRVTYCYEKDDGSVPSGVLVALDKLNRQGILATAFEEDTVDGSGETPEQYKSALNASKGNRPALVVERGNESRVLPKVTTTEQVMEAIKP